MLFFTPNSRPKAWKTPTERIISSFRATPMTPPGNIQPSGTVTHAPRLVALLFPSRLGCEAGPSIFPCGDPIPAGSVNPPPPPHKDFPRPRGCTPYTPRLQILLGPTPAPSVAP